jgi:NAD-dependent dihydropyrimidine dehydrogenase PreA subunit
MGILPCCPGRSVTKKIRVGDLEVGIADLDGILAKAAEMGDASESELKKVLMRETRKHNYVPAPAEQEYLAAIWAEFVRFRERDAKQKAVTRIEPICTAAPKRDPMEGIPRNEVQWFPTIDRDKCTSCGACAKFCHKGVYESGDEVKVVNPYNCVVGCTGCVSQCPEGAISFPSMRVLATQLHSLKEKYQKGKARA